VAVIAGAATAGAAGTGMPETAGSQFGSRTSNLARLARCRAREPQF
jgi:hypothetical protein